MTTISVDLLTYSRIRRKQSKVILLAVACSFYKAPILDGASRLDNVWTLS